MSVAYAYIIVGVLVAFVGYLSWQLLKNKKVQTVEAPKTPKMEQAINNEISSLEKRVLVEKEAEQARLQLEEIQKIEDKKKKLAELAKLAKQL